MKNIVLKNIKPLVFLLIGIVVSSFISIKAATTLASSSIYYDTSKSGGSSSNVNGAIDELYSISSDRDELKKQILNLTYPVGSIYFSATDDTVEKVQERFGGTWVRYAEDMTLVGYKENTNKVNDTGGSKTVTLTTANLPSHSHSFTPAGSVSSSFTGSQVSTSTNGNHNHSGSGTTSKNGDHSHSPYNGANSGFATFDTVNNINSTSVGFATSGRAYWASYSNTNTTGAHSHTYSFTTSTNGNHSHTVTARGSVSSSFTGSAGTTGSTGSGTAFNTQDPYIVLYMYKRTE